MVVGEPFEFWDWNEETERTIRVERWEMGETLIAPRYPGAPPEKRIQVLRLHLAPGIKPHLPQFWDLTSKHLIAALEPQLRAQGLQNKEFRIVRFGEGVRTRFSLEVRNI